jgi:peroxiredoxin
MRVVSAGRVTLTYGGGASGLEARAGGLPVGAPAPGFTLPSTDGDRHALGSLLASGVPLLLVFSDAGCGPCDALLPELAGWQHDDAQQLAVAVIASGDPDGNREKAQRHELARVLLQSEREVSDS